MLIDWFTVVAQAINFLILVWLLKRFLYQPILNALDAREQRIAAELADADAKKAEAQTEREEFKRKNDEFDGQRTELFNQVTIDAATERQRLFDAARKDADSLRTKQQDTLRSEYQNLNEEIARRTRAEVFAIARQALTDLAGSSLEERMVEVFVQRLHELDVEEKKKWALESSSATVLVRSAFDLSTAQRTTIEGAVKAMLTAETQVKFEMVADLVSGIELLMQGKKIAWSISDYLVSLEKGAGELLKEKAKPEAKTEPKPETKSR